MLPYIGWDLWKLGRPAAAASAFAQERPVRERLAAAGEATGADRNALAKCETNAAAALVAAGRPAEARACCDRAIAIRERLVKEAPANADFARELAESLLRSGHARAAAGDLTGAATDWRRAAALYAAHSLHNEPAFFHACCHGALAGLAGKDGSGVAAEEGRSHAAQAMAILQRLNASGYRDPDLLRVEPGLDPLRSREDFCELMMDQIFPADPFVTAR
jgi:hypothetical protein